MSDKGLNFDGLTRLIRGELVSRGHPGSTVTVAKDEEIVFSKGFGHANLEDREKADADTVYRCASITKPVVTTGFMQLYEEEHFKLGDSANQHLDVKIETSFREEPTIRDLLTHYSGMPTRVPPLVYTEEEAPTIREYLKEAAIATKAPGEVWAYCNTAFTIIGYLIKRFTGESYDTYLRKNVLKPLDMNSSDFEVTPELEDRMAQGYKRPGIEGELTPVKSYINGTRPADPCGSLLSTTEDLAKFAICHLNKGCYEGERILEPETVELMGSLQAPTGDSESGMGLSWFRSIHHGRVMLSHTGGVPGFANHLALYPEEKLAASWLSNLNDGTGWRPPAPNALWTLLGNDRQGRLDTLPADWENLIGRYKSGRPEAQVRAENGYLTLDAGGKTLLEKIEKDRYLIHGSSNDGYEVTFKYDPKGVAQELYLRTQVFSRYKEEEPEVDADAKLKGTWEGKYVHPYGIFPLTLKIIDESTAYITEMTGNETVFQEFIAKSGRVNGTYKTAVPVKYRGWGVEELQSELDLLAVEGVLEGTLTLTSEEKPYRFVTDIKLKRVTN